ncbi:putative bifunctional diguanylate cyclase/phosphodiesterase [Cochlodiniinecator piscidefendens]|uniref:putative bifunctional diguanylate cyclase/phosphodiesterase n=1 Tax=Cochlodiniinecator piscidefendens TaxID=2715756 RepID=UPI00140E0B7B|nr:bifunctional diguanylate cyclase/phosphodiesterase [Cochlodiniinecator piscidefendens]
MWIWAQRAANSLRDVINGPELFAFLPAATLIAFWVGGETGLIGVALLTPALFLLLGRTSKPAAHQSRPQDALTGFTLRDTLLLDLDDAVTGAAKTGKTTACLVVELNGFKTITDRFGHRASEEVLRQMSSRLRASTRSMDTIARTEAASFAIALAPVQRADLEALIQIASRIQDAITAPFNVGAATAAVNCSIGFCLASRSPEPSGESMLNAAETALTEANRAGHGSIRSFSNEMYRAARARNLMFEEVAEALEAGQIIPWFQPQISTDTGELSGLEALARWQHPKKGLVSPGEFLPSIEEAGLSERLGEVILGQTLRAIRDWDTENIRVPMVGVNFCMQELSNPQLATKIQWELDRYEIAPERLCIEVLETVVAGQGDDIVTRNIETLAGMGCSIDLDDFGTGHASISNIRQFAISRIKIDRSFVLQVEDDAEQQRMISAVLTMAERLGLDTLAEGVETIGAHAMLSQLGCAHVQGFGIARPMPFADVAPWLNKHSAKLARAPQIGRKTN